MQYCRESNCGERKVNDFEIHRKSSTILSSTERDNQTVLKVFAGERAESTVLNYIKDRQLNPTPQEMVVSMESLWSSLNTENETDYEDGIMQSGR